MSESPHAVIEEIIPICFIVPNIETPLSFVAAQWVSNIISNKNGAEGCWLLFSNVLHHDFWFCFVLFFSINKYFSNFSI